MNKPSSARLSVYLAFCFLSTTLHSSRSFGLHLKPTAPFNPLHFHSPSIPETDIFFPPTASMATTCVPTSPKSGFLALPGEIRNEIYRMLLTTRYTFPNDFLKTPLSLHPAILRVNRQINEEATNVLHGDNYWIIAQINIHQWPGANAIIPFVSRKDPSHIKYPALHVKLDLLCESMATESTTLIMGVESLPFFLHELRSRSVSGGRADDLKAAGLALRLYSSPFHSQQKLRST